MKTLTSLTDMQQQTNLWRAQGKRIGFVPTMGFLHDGHLSLIQIAKEKCDVVVCSIFVNPTQFGPNEDFEKYPRDEQGDLEKLKGAKTDVVFLPIPQEMYKQGFQTTVHLSQMTKGLCGAHRPGHFDGVATVVLKLFNLVKPHVAVFGEKDYQQLAVIRQMVNDLNLDTEIIGAPTQRSAEGLALSSRNAYLSADEKQQALGLSQAITLIQKLYQQGEKKTKTLTQEAKKLLASFSGVQLEYLEIVESESLQHLEEVKSPARVLIAARVGKTRLIDNGPVF